MEKLFQLGLRGTDKKTEIIAGLTTFMTMAYVLAVPVSYTHLTLPTICSV